MQTIKNQGEKFPRVERCGNGCRTAVNRAACRPGLAVFLVLLLALCGLASGCRPPGVRALLKGKDLLQRGKSEQAVSELRTATSLLKTNAIAFNYLGLALHENGQFAEAETAYHRALALNHELPEVRYNLGCLYLAQNKVEPAKSEFTAFTLRRPETPEGWIKLATTQLRSREAQAAERNFGQALRLKPQDPECLTGIGLARLQRNRPAEALQFFRNALKVQPDYSPALLNVAVVAQEYLRDKTLALQHYRLYLSSKPAREDSAAVQKIAQQLEQELAPQRAATPALASNQAQKTANYSIKAALADHANPGPAPVAPSAAPASNNLVIAQKGPISNKSRSPTIEIAARSAPATNDTRPQRAAAAKPPEPVVQPKSASVSTAASPPLQVVEVPEDPVFKAAQDLPARITSAGSGTTPGNAKTQSLASAASKPAKRGFLSKLNPARIFASDDNTPSASATSPANEASSASKPEVAEPTRQQMAAGTPAIARYKYLSPPKPQPGDRSQAEQAYAQGVEAEKSRRLSLAIQAYQRAAQLDPAYYQAYYNLGVTTAASGELPAALAAYEHALAIEDRLDARYNFALALKQSDFLVDARIQFEKMLATYPNESRAHLALANLYAQQFHDPVKAREHYLKVLENDPQNPQAANIRYWLAENPVR